jgi:putative transposase
MPLVSGSIYLPAMLLTINLRRFQQGGKKVLSRVFRGKFVAGLRTAFNDGSLRFHHSFLHLANPRHFAAWLRTLFRHDWVVYAKRPFGGPEHVLRYLGAYTHRVAISNHRLVALNDDNVCFRWRDSAHGNKRS